MRWSRPRAAVVGLALAVPAAGGLLLARRRAPPPNVLVITLDTLRADRLGSLRLRRGAHTPAGRASPRAACASPRPPPSRRSPCPRTRRSSPGRSRPSTECATTAGSTWATSSRRWRRCCASAATARAGSCRVRARPAVGHPAGLRAVTSTSSTSARSTAAAGMDAIQRRAARPWTRRCAGWREDRERPFLAWVHLYDPHAPYRPPGPFRRGSRPPCPAPTTRRSRAPTRRSGGCSTRWPGRTPGRHGGGRAGRPRRDAGRARGAAHGFFIYDAAVRIPLIVAGPRVPSAAVGRPGAHRGRHAHRAGSLGVPAPRRSRA